MSEINPYAPPASALADRSRVLPSQLKLAERGTRLGAIILDALIVIVPLLLLVWAAYEAFGLGTWVSLQETNSVLITLGTVAAAATLDLAVNGILLSRYGQTVGKRICKIRIAKPNGDIPSLFDSFVKRRLLFSLAQQIPVAGAALAFADPLFIFRENRRCLHDDVADTIVVEVDVVEAPAAT